MILPLIAIYCINRGWDVYRFRSLLTENGNVIIALMLAITIFSFFFNKGHLNKLVNGILVIETCLGTFMYVGFYDKLLTY